MSIFFKIKLLLASSCCYIVSSGLKTELKFNLKDRHIKRKKKEHNKTQVGLGWAMGLCGRGDVYHGNLFPSHNWDSEPCKLRVT